jgi:hypothetical protein
MTMLADILAYKVTLGDILGVCIMMGWVIVLGIVMWKDK